MLFYTHLAFSFFVGLFVLDYLKIQNKLIFLLFILIFSLFPDIDAPKSKIGKKLGIISKIINFIFGHRDFFHSLFFIIPIYIIFSIFSDILAVSFLVSSSSHLVIDALTKEGISPFYPLKLRVKGFIKTGKFLENFLFILIIALIIAKLSSGQI
jgi:inner membrane protein